MPSSMTNNDFRVWANNEKEIWHVNLIGGRNQVKSHAMWSRAECECVCDWKMTHTPVIIHNGPCDPVEWIHAGMRLEILFENLIDGIEMKALRTRQCVWRIRCWNWLHVAHRRMQIANRIFRLLLYPPSLSLCRSCLARELQAIEAQLKSKSSIRLKYPIGALCLLGQRISALVRLTARKSAIVYFTLSFSTRGLSIRSNLNHFWNNGFGVRAPCSNSMFIVFPYWMSVQVCAEPEKEMNGQQT